MKKRIGYLAASALLCAMFVAPSIQADQPHMQSALEHLRAAQSELEKADHDKGGHREKALDATRRAIQQVEAGMRFDRRH